MNSGAPDILTLRRWLIVSASLLLALFAGYLLADPFRYSSLGFVAALTGLLLSPVLIRHYHPLLICAWNLSIILPFFPGKPSIGWVLSCVGFTIALLNRSLNHSKRFVMDKWLMRATLLMVGMLLLNAYRNGGLGLGSLGSDSVGGKKFALIFGAIVGMFALTSVAIPKHGARNICSLYFLTMTSTLVSYAIYFAGPAFYLLFYFFPPETVSLQTLEWAAPGQESATRFVSFGPVSTALCAMLQLRFGLRHLLSVRGLPWLVAYLIAFSMGLVAGFRSVIAFNIMIFAAQFVIEGLHKTRRLPLLILCIGIVATAVLPFVHKLPFSIQRSLSFLPLDVDPMARHDAESSANWRFEMWGETLKIWKQKWLLGKGYSIDPTDMYFAQEGVQRGILPNFEPALIAGDYHSGPLSLLVPFGAVGAVTFLIFFWCGFRMLLKQWRNSVPELRNINAMFLAYFASKVVFFFAIFGSISSDMATFTGILGLSLAINRDYMSKEPGPETPAEAPTS